MLEQEKSAQKFELPAVLVPLFDGKTAVTTDELADVKAEHIRAAKTLYDEDKSPQRHGNRLRAKWLAREGGTP